MTVTVPTGSGRSANVTLLAGEHPFWPTKTGCTAQRRQMECTQLSTEMAANVAIECRSVIASIGK